MSRVLKPIGQVLNPSLVRRRHFKTWCCHDGDVCPHTNFSPTLLYDGAPRGQEFGHKYHSEEPARCFNLYSKHVSRILKRVWVRTQHRTLLEVDHFYPSWSSIIGNIDSETLREIVKSDFSSVFPKGSKTTEIVALPFDPLRGALNWIRPCDKALQVRISLLLKTLPIDFTVEP